MLKASELQQGLPYWGRVLGLWIVVERTDDRIYWIGDEVGADLAAFEGDVFIGPIDPPPLKP